MSAVAGDLRVQAGFNDFKSLISGLGGSSRLPRSRGHGTLCMKLPWTWGRPGAVGQTPRPPATRSLPRWAQKSRVSAA